MPSRQGITTRLKYQDSFSLHPIATMQADAPTSGSLNHCVANTVSQSSQASLKAP